MQKKNQKSKSSEEDEEVKVNEFTVKPKRACTAYLYFNVETAPKIRAKDSALKMGEVSQKVGQVWAALNDKQKEKYIKLAEADKARYAKQCKELETKGFFMTADNKKSNDFDASIDPKQKYGKDVLLPKKPCSSYLLWNTANIKLVKEKEAIEKYPDAMKRMGVLWGEMTEKQKKKWNDLAVKDKTRHVKQLEDLMKNGYFKMADGSKSSEHKAKPPKQRREKAVVAQEASDDEPTPKKRVKK